MGCQKGIAKAIVDKGADYIFGLKGNPPNLHAEVLEAFDDSRLARLSEDITSYVETADKGQGRNEVRRVGVWRDIGWLAQSDAWPGYSGTHSARRDVARATRVDLEQPRGGGGARREGPRTLAGREQAARGAGRDVRGRPRAHL